LFVREKVAMKGGPEYQDRRRHINLNITGGPTATLLTKSIVPRRLFALKKTGDKISYLKTQQVTSVVSKMESTEMALIITGLE